MRLRLASVLLTALMALSSIAFSACSSRPLLVSSENVAAQADMPVPPALMQVQAGYDASPARIAVTHRFTLRMPSGDIEAVQRHHLEECAEARMHRSQHAHRSCQCRPCVGERLGAH